MWEPETVRHQQQLVDKWAEAADDAGCIAQLADLQRHIELRLAEAVHRLRQPTVGPDGRAVPGLSWAELAFDLGMTRDGAAKRFREVRPGLSTPRAPLV